MAFGLGVLRLSSQDFWMTTPREIAAAMNAFGAEAAPMRRDGFARLMRMFPDAGEKRDG
jgi:uncharacterized phage protein (TIGR02216 family)